MTESRPLEPADLYRLRLVSDPQIAPDGSRIAFVRRHMDEEKNDYVSNIFVVDREGSVAQFTSGGKDAAPRWSPDGKWLAFLSAKDDKRPQVRLLSTSGGESVALTDRRLGAGVPFWSPDSSAIVFTGPVSTDPDEEEDSKDEKDKKKPAQTKIVERASYKLDGAGYIGNRRRHLFRIDVAERKVEQLTEGDFHDDEPAWSPDGRHIAFSTSRNPRWDVTLGGDIYIIPREGGEARKVVAGNFDSPFFSPDGSRIGFIGREDADDIVSPPRIFSADRSGGNLREELGSWDGTLGDWVISDVMTPNQPITTPEWRADGITFLGTVRGEANVLRVRDGSVEAVTEGAHAIIGFSFAGDGTLALARGDSTHLADIYLRENGEDRQLTHENDEFLQEVRIATPERFSFTGANGEESEGWLLAPVKNTDSGKKPLIVYLHGGPQFAHGEAFFFEYQLLAAQGFGVFYPNIHGSTSYGRQYQKSIRADWGNLDFQDVLAGTKAAIERPWVDEHRLGIAGGSYGGYMTLWTVGHSKLFRAALAERSLSNFVSFMGTSDSGWIWNRIAGAFPEDDVQKLWDMSPIKYVADIQIPVLVMHSERDDRTPIEQGEQIFLALRRLGRDTKLIMFPEESHGLSRGGKPSRRVERLGYVLEWFREKL
jgi:dipeptidyl aminopeptidase/acylaminoacyl peptidase